VRRGSCRASPNLPWTIAGGIDGDRPYLTMKYLGGTTVAWLIDENVPLPIHTARAWGYGPACGSSYRPTGTPTPRQATVKCPDGLVRVHCLGTRAQAPLPGHQGPAGSCHSCPFPHRSG